MGNFTFEEMNLMCIYKTGSRTGLIDRLLHDGLFLFPFLPMGSGSQIHQGNGLTASG